MDTMKAWLSGKVKRYHIMETIHQDLVASHTWGVLTILLCVWPFAPRHVILAAQFHDAGEKATGDMPGPTKWGNPVLESEMDRLERAHIQESLPERIAGIMDGISAAEWGLVELCDRAEFCYNMIYERMLGNRYAEIYYKRAWDKMTATLEEFRSEFITMDPDLITGVAEMRRDLDDNWRKARA